jgi:hypothetical protein
MGVINRRVSVQVWVGKNMRHFGKTSKANRAASMAQMVKSLSSKCKALSSNPNTTWKGERKEEKRKEEEED